MEPNNQDPKDPKDPTDPQDPQDSTNSQDWQEWQDPQDAAEPKQQQEPVDGPQEPRHYGQPEDGTPAHQTPADHAAEESATGADFPADEFPQHGKHEAGNPEGAGAHEAPADEPSKHTPDASEEPKPFPSTPDTPWDSAAASGKYDSWGRPLDEDWDTQEPYFSQDPQDAGSYGSYQTGPNPSGPYPGSAYPGAAYPGGNWGNYGHPSGNGFSGPGQPQELAEEPQKIPNFNIFDAFGTAWRTFSRSPLPWVGFGALAFVGMMLMMLVVLIPMIIIISTSVDDPTIVNEEFTFSGPEISLLVGLSVLSSLFGMLISVMTCRAAILAMRGKELRFGDIFTFKNLHFFGAVGVQLLILVGTIIGLVLLLIPGIFIGLCQSVALAHYFLRPERGPVEAFKAALKTGVRNPLALIFVAIAAAILGSLGGFTIILLPLVLPLSAMLSIYLAMLSLHERPAFMDEAEDPFGTNYPTRY